MHDSTPTAAAVDFAGEGDLAGLFDPDAEALAHNMDIEDPYPKVLALAARGPVLKGALHDLMGLKPQHHLHWDAPGYSAFSFAAVNQVFLDGETFTNHTYDSLTRDTLGDTLLNMDGDRHRRNRNVAKPWFKPSFAETWWNDRWIADAVDDLFDRICMKTHADLNMELCAPLPVSVVSRGFGMATEDVIPFRQAVVALTGRSGDGAAQAHGATVDRILGNLIAQRRRDPQDDLISRFVTAQFVDDDGTTRGLADDEIKRYCTLIVFAGGGTTWRQLGITLMALLQNPDQLETLRADRSLIRATIQESARWYPTDPLFARWVAKDTTLCGVDIPAGSALYLCLSSANRDPAVWTDPDRFDITRPVQRNFAFGAGIHACLGQHLSRQEMEVALDRFLDRLGNVRLDPDRPAPRMSGGTLMGRGPNALPVRFDPAG